MFLSLALLLVFALTISIVSWWLWFTFSNACRLINKFPGPRPTPLIGDAFQLVGGCPVILKTVHDTWPSVYGEIFHVFIATKLFLIISSPEIIETIVNHPKLLAKGTDYKLLHPWLGLGLLTSSGSKWKSRRRLLTPAFHFHIMEDFFDTFNEQSSILCHKIDKLCRDSSSTEMNMEELTSLCTLDVICETAMGCKVNAQTEESEYVKAVYRMATILVVRGTTPWYNSDFIFDRTASGKEYHRCLQILLDFTKQVVKTRRQEYLSRDDSIAGDDDMERKRRRPFLDLLLETADHGAALTDADISEEVNTFMFEGHDTTAATLNWFLYCMASNPHCQELVREELIQVFGVSDRPCTRQDLSELKYLECCIKETLRLYPAVPMFVRLAKEEVDLGDFRVPKECNLEISVYALHHNPRIYPDPFTFNPDRFSMEQSIGRHPYAFIPFSAGPRNCIGQRFAMAEEKVILSNLLRRFKFELPPTASKPIASLELTLKSATGFHLLVSRLE